ncbi:hypothetical protein SUDANB95_05486 [Actinosynnema sp. ALI-1.44]
MTTTRGKARPLTPHPVPCNTCGQKMFRQRRGVATGGRRFHAGGGVCRVCRSAAERAEHRHETPNPHPHPCRGCFRSMYCRRAGAVTKGYRFHAADGLCTACRYREKAQAES